MKRIQFTAYGTPQPKGSTRAFMRPGMRFPVVTSDNPNLKGWAAHVRTAAQEYHDAFISDRPVRVCLHFELKRPQRLLTKNRRSLSFWHTTKPDLDKLARAVKDALTGVLWTDDSQVAQLVAEKVYADADTGPCVHVTVEEMPSVR